MTDTDLVEVHRGDAPELAGLELPEERVVEPVKRRLRLRNVPSEMPVIRVLAARDIKVKYKQSLLGPIWLFFQPLALLAGFLVAFNGLVGVKTPGVPYVPFALVGLSIWAFFQAAMTVGGGSLLTNSGYIRYTPCPRLAFPISGVISSLPAFGITATGALVAAGITGVLDVRVALLPIVVVWLFALTLGIVAILSSAAVRYRDVVNALPFLLQVAVFFAPVGYPLWSLGPTVRTFVELNPLTGVIEAARWTILSGYDLSVRAVVISVVGTVLVVIAGWLQFSRRETTMADDI